MCECVNEIGVWYDKENGGIVMFDYLNVSDNVSLFYMKHLVPNPRGTIVMCHGFTNHSGDYEHYIKMLNAENYSEYS